MTRRPRPTMHGRDHAPDGPDPIPGLVLDGGGDGVGIQYEVDNEGEWLDIGIASRDADNYGVHIHDDSGSGGDSVRITGTGGTGALTGLDVHASNTGGATVIGVQSVATGSSPIAFKTTMSAGWGYYADVSGGNGVQINVTGGNGVVVNMPSGSGFAVYVTVGGLAVFAVASDGKVYMRQAPVIGPF